MKELSKNSMLYWFPLIKDLPIPQPKTAIVRLNQKEKKLMGEEKLSDITRQKVMNTILAKFSLPVFIRTDFASGKHSWEKSCFYNGLGTSLWHHLYEIMESNLLNDLWFNASSMLFL